MTDHPAPISPTLERALRWAAQCHRGQRRKGSDTPYIQHPMAVALILDRAGFPEEVVIAGLLHDVVEDTDATEDQVRTRFGPTVAELVRHATEIKLDAEGRKRPWLDRKRDHLEALASAPVEARAVALADKLHNLLSIRVDLDEGRPVWSAFSAAREQVLWYYRSALDRLGVGDPRLDSLAAAARALLADLDTRDGPAPENREAPPLPS